MSVAFALLGTTRHMVLASACDAKMRLRWLSKKRAVASAVLMVMSVASALLSLTRTRHQLAKKMCARAQLARILLFARRRSTRGLAPVVPSLSRRIVHSKLTRFHLAPRSTPMKFLRLKLRQCRQKE